MITDLLPEGCPELLAAELRLDTFAVESTRLEAVTARVNICGTGTRLRVTVWDDGRGGAILDGATGLGGPRDRVSVFGGTLLLSSPPGGGMRVEAGL